MLHKWKVLFYPPPYGAKAFIISILIKLIYRITHCFRPKEKELFLFWLLKTSQFS